MLMSRSFGQASEMGFCLGAVVEAKDTSDDIRVLARDTDDSGSAAEISVRIAVLLEFHIEGFLKVGHGTGKNYGSAGKFGAGFLYLQVVFLCEFFDFCKIGGFGAVGVLELRAGHVFKAGFFQSALQLFPLGFGFRAEAYGNFDGLVRMRILNQARTSDGLTFTACNSDEFSRGSHRYSFVPGEQSGQELFATGNRAVGKSRFVPPFR